MPDAKDIFLAALDQPAVARAAFLDEACAGQPELRQRVELLLAAHEDSGLPRVPGELADTGEVVINSIPPTAALANGASVGVVIAGRYTLEQRIGEGGMGEVWVARQSEPVKRRVALKLIKRGMDSAQVLARFEQERQALAVMDHPNIARVLDGGIAGDAESFSPWAGSPFFVMELVAGLPLNKFCDEAKLPVRERLELFVAICQAVQHAHQKGIVHRDLKPANILVTLVDGQPTPKIIDFGVAKAVSGKLTDDTLATQFGAVVGTLEYMSPEQAGLTTQDIDTRADIYSLGVILYELLTGLRPIDSKRLKKAALDEIIRMIRDEEPPSLASRLSTNEGLPAIAAVRQLEPHRLLSLVKGELDWIVHKCLEKNRNRRYESASGLARDLQRYLADEPVEARPVSTAYRLRKFVRRNKGPVAAGVALLLLLALGITGTSLGLAWALKAEKAASSAAAAEAVQRKNAETQRDEAVAAKKQAVADRLLANKATAVAQAVNRFILDDLLAEAAPERNARSKEVTVVELLGRVASRVGDKFKDQPLVEAALRRTIGIAYRKLGNNTAAQPQLERALEINRQALEPDHTDTLFVMNSLAVLHLDQGQYAKAESLLVQTLAIQRRDLGENNPHTLASMHNLGMAYTGLGQLKKAEPLYLEALAGRRRVMGEEHLDTLTTMNNLAVLYEELDQPAKAEPLYLKGLEVGRRMLGEAHPYTINAMHNLGDLYRSQSRFAEAEPLCVGALEVSRRVLGPEHANTLAAMNNLAALYRAQGQFAKVEPLLVQALAISRRVYGEEHPQTLATINFLALNFRARGEYTQAEPLFVQVLATRTRRLGPEHPETLMAMSNLGLGLLDLNRFAEAEPLLVKALALRRRILGETHANTLRSISNLAMLYLDQGKPDLAEPLCREALEKVRGREAKGSAPVADALAQLGSCLRQQRKSIEAEALLRECLAIRLEKEPDLWTTFQTKSMLGGSLADQKRFADAETELVAGFQGLKQREAKISPQGRRRLPEAAERLVQLYQAWGKPDQADKWQKEVETLRVPRAPTPSTPASPARQPAPSP